MRLAIQVLGRPAPQGSKRTGGAGQLLEQSDYLPAWKQAIRIGVYRAYAQREIAEDALPLFPAGTPIYIESCVFYVGPEQCRADGTHEPIGTPDIDKLLRGLLDALGGGRRGTARLFADDSQIVRIANLSKQRAGHPDRTGALIIVSDGKD